MRMRVLALPLLATGALLASIALADPVPVPNDVPALAGVVGDVSAKTTVSNYAVYDAKGHRKGSRKWRVTNAGGNCCEVYTHVGPTGRIFEMGGTYMLFSDDRGQHWKRVTYVAPPEGPQTNGEGAVTVAPNGDIVGITWDPYSGDVLTSYKYTAAKKTWETALTPLHGPFFDRPWISVIKGPVTVNGKTAPYATLVRGAYPNKDVHYLSLDGLHYDLLSTPAIDDRLPAETSGRYTVPVVKDPMADWVQDVPTAGAVYLNGGGALKVAQSNDGDDLASCPVSLLTRDGAVWHCVTPATEFKGTTRQDSRGWLTRAYPNGAGMQLDVSVNGARSWASLALPSPVGGKFEGVYDVNANGKLHKAVVLARFDDPTSHKGQDVAFIVDISRPQPKLIESMLVGQGDLVTAAGVTSSSDRFDFMTVGFTPDGKVVASMDDKTGAGSPLVAIQL